MRLCREPGPVFRKTAAAAYCLHDDREIAALGIGVSSPLESRKVGL